MREGLFLSVEGIDGSGKTTAIGELDRRLVDAGYRTLLLREPGGTAIGEDVRKTLLDPRHGDMDPLCELLLFAAARAQLVAGVVRPALAAGMVVICDRFTDSTLAYQGYGRGLDLDMIRRVNRIATGGLMPRRTLLLDLDPELAACRLVGRPGAGPDRIDAENRAFAERVRAGYLTLAREESDRIVTIAADRSIREVVDRMHETLREDLP
ncbi:MAG: dTMP kinase [Bacillota bacterium]|nr:dTMP kinase [Bacillota bacterium]